MFRSPISGTGGDHRPLTSAQTAQTAIKGNPLVIAWVAQQDLLQLLVKPER
jgi:hypothetical protein